MHAKKPRFFPLFVAPDEVVVITLGRSGVGRILTSQQELSVAREADVIREAIEPLLAALTEVVRFAFDSDPPRAT